MGYGLGVFLLALGLILALAVQDSIGAIDLTMIGWILCLAGVLVIVLTAVQLNSRRRTTTATAGTTTTTTTHPDGSQTVRRSTDDPPPPAV
jgi:hypothetical protein